MGKPVKHNEYLQFIAWFALPASVRKPKTQKGLAEKLQVEESTLSDWKLREDFYPLVRASINEWAKTKTPEVIQSIYLAALSVGGVGQAANAKLWLQYIEQWVEVQKLQPYDPEKEEKAKSLLDVYNAYNDPKAAKGKAKPKARSNKRSAKAKASKPQSKTAS